MFVIRRGTGFFDRYAVYYNDRWCFFIVDYFFTKRGAKKFAAMLNSRN